MQCRARFTSSGRENPFYRGSCVQNGTEQCCGPRRPSALKLRERYSDPYFTEADSDVSDANDPSFSFPPS